MIQQIKQMGFEDGYKTAKVALESGKLPKSVSKIEKNEKEIAKQLMEEFKFNREKAFRFAVVYSLSFDKGLITAIYEE